MKTEEAQTIQFETSDGWQLSGSLYTGKNATVAVLISAGTGFPRRFYRHIAAYFASRGAVVLTYDYRGIADSRGGSLENSSIDYPDWGRYDMTAALDTLEAAAPNLPLTHLGHSVGGHFLGLMPNQHKIRRHAFVSIGTGYVWKHHWKNIPLELYFWWGMGPYSLMRYNYINAVAGWRGEALPANLFKTWRRWSHRRTYFKPEINTLLAPQHYEKVTAPIHSWVFTDDPIATPTTAKDLLSCYPNAPHEVIVRKPSEFGLKRIGHEGAFRLGREALWAECWHWLAETT